MTTSTQRLVVLLLVAVLVLAAGGVGLMALLSGDADPPPRDSQGSGQDQGDDGDEDRTPAPPGPPEEGATTPPSAGLARFYEQPLAWEVCGDLDCARVEVPLDYRRPRGQTVELALNRRPADDPDRSVGPLVVNPGGPGGSATQYVEQSELVMRPELLERVDLVGMDPRGTGLSEPVDCLSDAELDEFLALDPDPDTGDEVAEATAARLDFFAGCARESGALVGHVTTVETARDLDVVRAVLGRAELDYLGASYGTKLGATYAELFPERVGRFVLDGAVDLSLDARESALQQAGGFETALRAFADNCLEVTEDDCFLGATTDEVLASIGALLEGLEDEPLPTSVPGDDRDLTRGLGFYGVVAALYSRDYWTLLSTGLRQAQQGDGSTLLLLAGAYATRTPDGYTSNLLEANIAINCLDDPTSIPPSRVPDQYDDFERASPTLGRVFAWGLAGCGGLEARAVEPPPTVRAQDAAPILVTGTTRDPATPYEAAVALADQLATGVLLTRDGDGHTAYNQGNECADAVIEDVLLEGQVPEADVDC